MASRINGTVTQYITAEGKKKKADIWKTQISPDTCLLLLPLSSSSSSSRVVSCSLVLHEHMHTSTKRLSGRGPGPECVVLVIIALFLARVRSFRGASVLRPDCLPVFIYLESTDIKHCLLLLSYCIITTLS